MARHTIIDKLDRELRSEITTERQVVYILAEIRKVLELTDEADEYFALNFHCCWALHTRMSRDGALRILQRFDRAHGEVMRTLPPDIASMSGQVRGQIHDTMACAKFRVQLDNFLEINGLPLDLVHSDVKWTTFLSLYTEVIEECPLQLSQEGVDLDHITAVTVYKMRDGWPTAQTEDGIVLFGAEWRLTCKNQAHNGKHSTLFVIPPTPISAID